MTKLTEAQVRALELWSIADWKSPGYWGVRSDVADRLVMADFLESSAYGTFRITPAGRAALAAAKEGR